MVPLCFVDPADAIRVIADSVGREGRRQLLGEAVRAWVDDIPEGELELHYAKALAELDEHDLSMLAAWHGTLEVGQPVPNRDFLMGAFGGLGENRREALKLAAGFRGEEAVAAGVDEDVRHAVLGDERRDALADRRGVGDVEGDGGDHGVVARGGHDRAGTGESVPVPSVQHHPANH